MIKKFVIPLLIFTFIVGVGSMIISCSLSPQSPQTTNDNNQGSGGSTTTYVTISGKLVSNYTAEWKVYAFSAQNVSQRWYGTVNTSTGDFSVQVVSNSLLVLLVAFKDGNNNNQHDSGEYSINATNFDSVVSDISNITIVIPLLSGGSFTVNVSDNLYNHKLGIAVVEIVSDGYGNIAGYSDTSTDLNFSKSINYTAASNVVLEVLVYEDKDNNNQPSFGELVGAKVPKDPVVSATNFTNDNTAPNTVNITLIPHLVVGSVSGDTDGMDEVVIGSLLPSFSVNPVGRSVVSGASYEVKYYTVLNSSSGNTNFKVSLFKDENSDGILNTFLDKKYVLHPSNITVDVNSPNGTTNTNDFDVVKVNVNVNITGADSSQFKAIGVQDYFSQLLGLPVSGSNPFSYVTYGNRYQNDYIIIILFKDEDNDGKADANIGFTDAFLGYEPWGFSGYPEPFDSSHTTNFTLTMGKQNINVIVTNNISPAQKATIQFLHFGVMNTFVPVPSSGSGYNTNFNTYFYYISSVNGFPLPDAVDVTLFDDSNGNGYMDSIEPTINNTTIQANASSVNL